MLVLATIKSILYFLSTSLFRIILYLAIISTVFVIAFGDAQSLKKTLVDSDVYEKFVPALIEENKRLPAAPGSLPYNDPQIVTIITSSFSPQDIQEASENFLSSVYSWLTKQTPTLTFEIDFTTNKEALATGIADYAFNRLRSLPVCTIPPSEVDPLTAECRPSNVDLDEAEESYKQQLFQSTSFLQNPVLTEQDLPRNEAGQTIVETYPYAPTLFTWARRAPLILGAILIIAVLEIVLFSNHKRRSIRSLAKVFMNSGLSLLFIPILFSFILPTLTDSFSFSTSTAGTSQLFSDVSDTFIRSIDTLLILGGVAIFVFGLVLYLFERVTRPRNEYNKLAKKAGLATANGTKPKAYKGKLNETTVPLQTSDGPKKKQQSKNSKYRTLKKKKDF